MLAQAVMLVVFVLGEKISRGTFFKVMADSMLRSLTMLTNP